MDLRLLEILDESDALGAGRSAQLPSPLPGLRGLAALLSRQAPGFEELLQGLRRQPGLECLSGEAAALVLGTSMALRAAGEALQQRDSGSAAAVLAGELWRRMEAMRDGPPGLREGKDGAWILPRRKLAVGRTLIMGIVNVTPDSFSDGGRFLDPGRAVEHGLRLASEGADLLDVGGESTRPSLAQPVEESEELRRVEGVVRELARQTRIPLSIDTTKAAVAATAIEAGAEIVNDVSGFARDPPMGAVCAKAGVAVCLMHLRGTPQDMASRATYADLHGEVLGELFTALGRAQAAGVAEERIALDPGLGFAKEAGHNLALLRRLRELLQLGRPVLVGASRKSFIGKLTGREPGERLHGSVAAAVLAAARGAAIVRVHDVAATREALAVADAVRGGAS